MSLKEVSMATQGMDVHHGEASPSSSPHGNSFVQSIDKKARSYLKTLERSFSFSMSESKGEDPSTMTIEYLRARLQAQRAEYKAEKERSQQLAKKVLELEQRLNFEVDQRRKAECNNMQLISPSYRSIPPSRLKDTQSYSEREGLGLINSKFKDNSSGEDDPPDWCSEISGSEGHPDADAVFLISPSSLRHRWESLRHERQQRADQHVISQFKEGTDGDSVLEKESRTLNHKELRDMPSEVTSCDEYASSIEGLKGIVDRESSKYQAITTEVKQKSTFEAWNVSYDTDSQSSRASNTFDIPDLGHEKPGHIIGYDNARRQASTAYNADKSFRYDSSQCHMHATHHPSNYLARPINSCQNYKPKNPSSVLEKMVSTNLPPQRGVYVQDFHASLEANAKIPGFGALKSTNIPQLSKSMSAGHDRILEYIVAHSNTIKEMQEERPSLRQLSNQESKSNYVKEILAPECMNDFELSALRQSSEKLHVQTKNATFNTCRSFSAVQTRCGRKLHGRWMSLDGGLDRLQTVGKEIGRGLEDGESAKLVMNNYH